MRRKQQGTGSVVGVLGVFRHKVTKWPEERVSVGRIEFSRQIL